MNDVSALPSIFVAYPGYGRSADSMRDLTRRLREAGASVRSWEDVVRPGFVWDSVASEIRESELVLAEITLSNENVLFELGFAIALSKPAIGLVDSTQKRVPMKLINPLNQIMYSNVDEIIGKLSTVDVETTSLSRFIPNSSPEISRGTLYFLPPQNSGVSADAILASCQTSFIGDVTTIDPNEVDYDRLTPQLKAVIDSQVFVTSLVSDQTHHSVSANAHVMMLAGFSAGLDREFLVLVEKPHRPLLDLGDRVDEFDSIASAMPSLQEWIDRTNRVLWREPTPRRSISPDRSSAISGFFMGHLDSRLDPSLESYFFETPSFHQAEAGHRQLFVGNKGAGKTAIFEILVRRFSSRNALVVRVAPLDFELPRLASIFEPHSGDVRWEFAYGSFWRFVLITEIVARIRDERMAVLLQRPDDQFARTLLDWISENEDLLTLDFVSRVANILSELASAEANEIEEVLQTARLYSLESSIRDFARMYEIRLFIDDLDRNFDARSAAARHLVVALFDAVPDLKHALGDNFKPAVFLRRDVFSALVAHDPEVSRRDPAFIDWDEDSLEILIARRISEHTGSTETDPRLLWREIFPATIEGQDTAGFIFSRTHLRPRDVIQYCQAAVESAQRAGRDRVAVGDVLTAWEDAGERILLQTEAEFQHRYPQISRLAFDAFFEGPTSSLWSELEPRLVMRARQIDPAPAWIEEALTNDHRALQEALFEAGIIGIETNVGIARYGTDVSHRELVANIGGDYIVTIHPAYRAYLKTMDASSSAGGA